MQTPSSKQIGIDKDQSGPAVEPAKKTTQVNLSMIAAVVIFFVIAAVAIFWFRRHTSDVGQQVHQQMQAPAQQSQQ